VFPVRLSTVTKLSYQNPAPPISTGALLRIDSLGYGALTRWNISSCILLQRLDRLEIASARLKTKDTTIESFSAVAVGEGFVFFGWKPSVRVDIVKHLNAPTPEKIM
jgi:hypothetical protein